MNDGREITELMERRRERRRRLAKLSFEEKIEIVERLRELRFNRHLMQKHLARQEFDELLSPEEMTHP